MFPEGMFWMFSWWFSFVCFFGNTNPFYVSEYEGMQQQKAASAVSQRLPAIVEDCCKITDLIQFKLRLHEQLIWGDKGSELRNCPSFSCQGDNQITGESMYLQAARWRCTLISNGGYYTSQFFFFFRIDYRSLSYDHPCTEELWSSWSCWRLNHISFLAERSKTAISRTHHGDEQDSRTPDCLILLPGQRWQWGSWECAESLSIGCSSLYTCQQSKIQLRIRPFPIRLRCFHTF